MTTAAHAEWVFINGKIATLDKDNSFATCIAIANGRILRVGHPSAMQELIDPKTQIVDLKGHTVIPGLHDSHLHLIRGGLNYNMELRWDEVHSLKEALDMLRQQVLRTPPPQWVRVVGGWSLFQFKERRMPTLAEINQISEETPIFILHLYDRALLNRAALKAIGYNSKTPDPLGGTIERDKHGNPTGLLIAQPNAMILYAALAEGPKLNFNDQMNSTRQFMRELNRLGVTSVCDAGGGFQRYPEDYQVINTLEQNRQLTVRIAYNLFTQNPGAELKDFQHWINMTKPGFGNDRLHVNGAGEMLVFSAADFEDFLAPRPDLSSEMEVQLMPVVASLVANHWPFRIHATYDESISRILNVLETVNQETPLQGLHWFIDHAETIQKENMERLKKLGGGIAIQNRMGFQGEYFVERYGVKAAASSPPITEMLRMGIPVGAGTDATRVASYNPWLSLYWLVSGKTLGGLSLYPETNCLDRMTALRLWTVGSSWFSNEDGKKGAIVEEQFADFAVLSKDYFNVPLEEIKDIESVLTVMDGKIVYATETFKHLSPPDLPVSPNWSPRLYVDPHAMRSLYANTHSV